jgi:DNA polymerase-1
MKLIIVDGHALIFRAYYAFQTANLKNSLTGAPSGAVFGFFRMLFKILQDYAPSHVALTFDPGTPLERSKIFKDYKANRAPIPDDLRPQVKEVIDICSFLGFKILQISGHEADDIIGTICEKWGKKDSEILIISGDKDLYQLLNSNIKLLRGKKGASEFIEIDANWVKAEIGIEPSQVTDYMGILGDPSDNIPGVKGIGEKGASKLIAEYSNLENIYNNIESIKNPSMKEKLIQSKEKAFLSRDLATIKKDIELPVSKDDLKLHDYLHPDFIKIFKERGYNVLYRDLAKESAKKGHKFESQEDKQEIPNQDKAEYTKPAEKGVYKRIRSITELKEILKQNKAMKFICVDTESTSSEPMRADILGISFSCKSGEGFYIPIKYKHSLFQKDSLDLNEVLNILKPILENPKIGKIGQNIKYDCILLEKYGVSVTPIYFDTMLASYILNPDSRRHSMDDLAEDFLKYKTITYDDLTGKGKKRIPLYEVDIDRVAEYASEDSDITYRLFEKLEPEIKAQGLADILNTIEQPLIPVLKKMEMTGVSIDKPYFEKLSKQFKSKIEELVTSIHKEAGRNFNINSTKELQVVLFDELKLPKMKKTQTGYSTDHSVLEELQGKHPIVDHLLEHRKYSKLLSTYIDSLPELINPETNRIHTSYNQTIAATGRLSSTDPNLQNIPIKDVEGKLIRKGFVAASKDFEILSLDYSQIELRIMAHFSKDLQMLEAYRNGLDIHTRTASGLFAVPESKVTPEMRNKAKVVNFAVIYGTTAFGLAQNLKISRSEAGIFIDKYFYQYPGVKAYMENISKFCLENGYVETLTGRKRFIPLINSTRRQEVEAAKRIAINSPIQGTSADMIKLAMIRIHSAMEKKKMNSKMIMQVHDELVFEVHVSEKDALFKLAKKEMENVVSLEVPIVVQGKFGSNWEEAH